MGINRKRELTKILHERGNSRMFDSAKLLMQAEGVPYYDEKSENEVGQILCWLMVDNGTKKLGEHIQAYGRVLSHRLEPHISRMQGNYGSLQEDPAAQFLHSLSEPAEKYSFTKAGTVFEYLLHNHDQEYQALTKETIGAGFDETVSLYVNLKTQQLELITKGLETRGPVFDKFGNEEVNRNRLLIAPTETTHTYLSKLRESFCKNPEAEEVIEFVNRLEGLEYHWTGALPQLVSDYELEYLQQKYNVRQKPNTITRNKSHHSSTLDDSLDTLPF